MSLKRNLRAGRRVRSDRAHSTGFRVRLQCLLRYFGCSAWCATGRRHGGRGNPTPDRRSAPKLLKTQSLWLRPGHHV